MVKITANIYYTAYLSCYATGASALIVRFILTRLIILYKPQQRGICTNPYTSQSKRNNNTITQNCCCYRSIIDYLTKSACTRLTLKNACVEKMILKRVRMGNTYIYISQSFNDRYLGNGITRRSIKSFWMLMPFLL